MDSINGRKKLCPTDDQFELLSLESELLNGDKKRTQIHLQQCEVCRDRFQEIDGFYALFVQEINKPITNGTLDFAKQIGKSGVKYGLILCDPVPEMTNGHGFAYKTKIQFVANGAYNPQKLSSFKEKLAPHQLSIRFMTDPDCNAVMIFVHTNEHVSLKGWALKLPGVGETILSQPGAGKIQSLDLKKMDNQIAYLRKIDDLVPEANERRIEKIEHALFD